MKFGDRVRTMKTLQSEAQGNSKRRGYRFWIGCSALLLGLPLLYYGYCWGWWGQQSLLLQYLFQCNCPAASTEARYPESVDVIVPACQYVSSMLSPSGRLLSVREKDSGTTSVSLLDLQTDEKVPSPVPEQDRFNFLTDNLLFVSSSYEEDYILDRTTEDQYPIREFRTLRTDAYIEGHANLNLLAQALQQAKFVFFRGQDDTIIALDPEFPTSAENNFLINRFGIPGEDPNRSEQFLKENNIVYQTILPNFPEEVVSPDSKFVARSDGIYLVETGQKIVEGYSASGSFRPYSREYFNVRGWSHDSRAVIYSEFLSPCLLEPPGLDGPGCIWEVPQPLLKLKVPEEYLLHPQTP
jgi:hypothetical protein